MKGSLKDITAAIDSSPASTAAVRWAAFLAQKTGASLHLLHVVESWLSYNNLLADIMGAIGMSDYGHDAKSIKKALEDRGRNILYDAAKIAEEYGVSPDKTVRSGTFHEVIKEISHETNLLVIGKLGDRSKLSAHIFGPNGVRAVQNADCACLVVPPSWDDPKRMVIGVDNGGPARSAIGWANFLAETFPKVDVKPIHVKEKGDDLKVTEVAGKAVEILEGDVEQEFLKVCGEDSHAISILGATAHTASLKEMIIGNLPTHVLHKTHGPVLIAR